MVNHWGWIISADDAAGLLLNVVVFVKGWKLSVVSLMQTTLYAVVTLSAGVLLFGEVLSPKQVLGLVFAIVGVVLLSF